jgi:hypothetical protein
LPTSGKDFNQNVGLEFEPRPLNLVTRKPPQKTPWFLFFLRKRLSHTKTKKTLIFHLFEKKVAARKPCFRLHFGWWGLFWTDGSQQLASSHLSAVGLKKDGVGDKSLTWKTNHDLFLKTI